MIRLLEKARKALLTDPVTGDPVHPADVINWAWVSPAAVLIWLAFALGLGAGR